MIIIWGSGLYGRTDEVPGLGYVATKFGHLWYIPLIPVGSHFVIEKSADGWRGAPIGLSGKSILLGWLRGGLIVGSIAAAIATFVAFTSPNKAGAWNSAVILAAVVVALIMTKRMKLFTRASYERACALADEIGFGAEARVLIDLAYGVVSEDEANHQLQALGEDGQDAFAGQPEFESHADE